MSKQKCFPAPCYCEIPVDDPERAQGFYSKLFDWEFSAEPNASEVAGSDMEYWTIHTKNTSENCIPNLGMLKRQNPQHPITTYFEVGNVDETCTQVTTFGGQVIFPKRAVPGEGYFAICLDTEFNVFGVWQADCTC